MSTLVSVNRTNFNGVPALQIRRRECSALISLLGGQVMSFQPAGARPVLWHNPDLVWSPGQTLRQGIPVCWPWFGDLDKNPEAVRKSVASVFKTPPHSAHGTARNSSWSLQSVIEDTDHTEVNLQLDNPPEDLSLTARYRFGESLSCELITGNQGTRPITLSMALHSYFPVSDIEKVSIQGLEGRVYIDALESWIQRKQAGSLRFEAETDRIYQNTSELLSLEDEGWRRRIYLRSTSSRSAVVWNPWIDKSRRLSQFSSESYRSMVCIETARVLDDSFTVEPGARSSLLLTISSEAFASPENS